MAATGFCRSFHAGALGTHSHAQLHPVKSSKDLQSRRSACLGLRQGYSHTHQSSSAGSNLHSLVLRSSSDQFATFRNVGIKGWGARNRIGRCCAAAEGASGSNSKNGVATSGQKTGLSEQDRQFISELRRVMDSKGLPKLKVPTRPQLSDRPDLAKGLRSRGRIQVSRLLGEFAASERSAPAHFPPPGFPSPPPAPSSKDAVSYPPQTAVSTNSSPPANTFPTDSATSGSVSPPLEPTSQVSKPSPHPSSLRGQDVPSAPTPQNGPPKIPLSIFEQLEADAQKTAPKAEKGGRPGVRGIPLPVRDTQATTDAVERLRQLGSTPGGTPPTLQPSPPPNSPPPVTSSSPPVTSSQPSATSLSPPPTTPSRVPVTSSSPPTASTPPSVTSPPPPATPFVKPMTSPSPPVVSSPPAMMSSAKPATPPPPNMTSPSPPVTSAPPSVASPPPLSTPSVTSPSSLLVSAFPRVTSSSPPAMSRSPPLPPSPPLISPSEAVTSFSPPVTSPPPLPTPSKPVTSPAEPVTPPAPSFAERAARFLQTGRLDEVLTASTSEADEKAGSVPSPPTGLRPDSGPVSSAPPADAPTSESIAAQKAALLRAKLRQRAESGPVAPPPVAPVPRPPPRVGPVARPPIAPFARPPITPVTRPSGTAAAPSPVGPVLDSLQFQNEKLYRDILSEKQQLEQLTLSERQEEDEFKAQTFQELGKIKEVLESRETDVASMGEALKEARAQLNLLRAKSAAELAQARQEVLELRTRLRFAEKALEGLKQVRVEYWGQGESVQLAGSFNGWGPSITLDADPSTEIPLPSGGRGPMMFACDMRLYPGDYEIKFIVDGNWQVDSRRQIVYRGMNQNNLLRVE